MTDAHRRTPIQYTKSYNHTAQRNTIHQRIVEITQDQCLITIGPYLITHKTYFVIYEQYIFILHKQSYMRLHDKVWFMCAQPCLISDHRCGKLIIDLSFMMIQQGYWTNRISPHMVIQYDQPSMVGPYVIICWKLVDHNWSHLSLSLYIYIYICKYLYIYICIYLYIYMCINRESIEGEIVSEPT